MSSERQPPDDRELEDFLAGRHPVGKAYREAAADEFAPPELDAAILQAARESVRTVRTRRPRWVQPVAVAATLTLSLGVLLNLWRNPDTREQVTPGEAPAADALQQQMIQAQTRADAEAAPSKELASRAEVAAEPPVAAAAAREQAVEVERKAEAQREAPADRARASSEHSAKRRVQETNDEGATTAPVEEARKSKAAAADAAAPAPESQPAPAPTSPPGAASSSSSKPAFVPAPPPLAAPAPPPPPPPATSAPSAGGAMNRAAPSAAPAPAADDRTESSRTRDEAPRRALGQAAPKSEPTPPQPMAKQGARPDSRAYSMQPSEAAPSAGMATPQAEQEGMADYLAPAEPPEWIRRIRELRDQGDVTGARRLLESFRAQYPGYAVPEDLRSLESPERP